MKLFFHSVLFILAFSTSGYAQTCRVEFFNSGVIHGSPLFPSVKLDLTYGKLDIPINDIIRITSGFHVEEKLGQDISAAIKSLGAANHADRIVADKMLRSNWEYSYTLLKQQKSIDREVSKRVEEIIDYIEKEKSKKLYYKDILDTVYLQDGSVYKGKIDHQHKKYQFDTKNMGKIEAHLGGIRDILFNMNNQQNFTLDISKNKEDEWVDSGIYVVGHCEIMASGIIDFWPSEVGRYVSGPGGSGSASKDGYLMGTLLMKMGDKTLKVGEGLSINFDEMTKLYFRIARPTWGIPEGPSGSYKINVQ